MPAAGFFGMSTESMMNTVPLATCTSAKTTFELPLTEMFFPVTFTEIDSPLMVLMLGILARSFDESFLPAMTW